MDVFQRLAFFSTLYWLLLRHVNGISTSGYLLITNVCYKNTASLTAAKAEIINMDGLECRRQCATRESCKACHVFTHSVTKNQICHLYLNNLCNTNEVMMYQNSYVTNGSIWEKISGENVNNAMTCKNEQNCVISTGFPTASTASLPPSSFTSLGTSGTTSGQVSGSSTYGSPAAIMTGTGLFNASTSQTPVIFTVAETSSTESMLTASSSSVQSSLKGNQTTGIATGNSSTGESTTGSPTTATISTSSTTETTISATVQNTTSSTSIPSTPTNPTITNITSPTIQSTTISITTASTTGILTTTGKPAEPRPRTCWEYYAYNGTLDVPGYGAPRPIWPTGFSNGTNITAYCRNGYTAIILNHIVFGSLPFYDNKNDVTVFGSTTQRLPSTNTTGWNAYISSINFPILSALVRASNRTLYYEQQADSVDAVGIYSGLDIAPDGTLTVQGILQIVKGSPSNGFSPPVINSSWVSGTCGSSFWKIPVTSTDICSQPTNLLLPAQNQKVGGTNRRYIGLAFR